MGRHRFSIAALMAAIAFLALALAVLRTGSSAGFRTCYATTLVVLLLAIVAARYRPGGEGSFWFGFAVFGSAYFLIGINPWAERIPSNVPGQAPYLRVRPNPVFPTEYLMEWLADSLRQPPTAADTGYETAKATAVYREAHLSITGMGHLMAVWIFGAVGGLMARLIAGCHPSSHRRPD